MAMAGAVLLPSAAQAAEPEMHFVHDAVNQFNALALRPEALGFSLSDSPDPSRCRHYQGMARKHGPGTPYLFITLFQNPWRDRAAENAWTGETTNQALEA